MEARPVQVHVVSDPPMLSLPNGVAAEQKEMAEKIIVVAMIPATHKLTQQKVMLSTDSGRAIPETTQKVMILPDEYFDKVARADLQLIKQA
ncbi:hypothetical protein L195_g054150 [Trifolium pratense]|uniref:Uncharacterized protein n=2 Tax=Trifolium pratense TaxID=57577 RepID=A0A2K3KEH6_TRIPR|nr:hypothetical protein L195_g054150 [Trifolium pratense]